MRWGFAWVDKGEAFDPETHFREDESIFGFAITHNEGEFPTAVVQLQNPRVGLLGDGRKQWAWISRDGEPLFFGRLLGAPQDMQDEIVQLTFVARPADFEAQREALAASLRVAPWYDEVWLSEQARLDPDAVLEGRSALWHTDRTTHAVTISDIIQGEDGTVIFEEDDVLQESVSVSHGASPLRRLDVTATVQWRQSGTGTLDITGRLLNGFAAAQPDEIQNIDNTKAVGEGMICVAGGDEFAAAWPRTGARIGGGWFLAESSATVIGDRPLLPLHIGDEDMLRLVRVELGKISTGVGYAYQWAFDMFKRAPGFITAVHKYRPHTFAGAISGQVELYWVPIWRIAPRMVLGWEATRERTETIRFSVSANVQPLLTDPDDEETATLTMGPANVDAYIEDVRRNRYFAGARGKRSMHAVLARARAQLLSRARAVTVSFAVPFEKGMQLSCRKSATILDPRLPDGQATGKVKSYTLSMDGQNGLAICTVHIGCTIGRSGQVEVEPGEPSYCSAEYVGDDYQVYENAVTVPLAGDLGYSGLDLYDIDDDGKNLFNVGAGFIEELTVTGGLEGQMNGIAVDVDGDNIVPHIFQDWSGILPTAANIADSINAVKTSVRLKMTPLGGGPFSTEIEPTVTELMVPRTINLEGELPTEGASD
jgi:hypothetical protein